MEKLEIVRVSNGAPLRLLEISAIPPKIIAFDNSGASTLKLNEAIMGGVQWLSSIGSNVDGFLYGSEPTPRKMVPTLLGVTKLSGGQEIINLGTAWFAENKGTSECTDYEKDVVNVVGQVIKHIKGDILSDLSACGMDQNAINYWEIPQEYITASRNGQYNPIDADIHGYVYAYSKTFPVTSQFQVPEIYNNKVGYGQSVRVTVYCPASGARLDKALTEILDPSVLPSASVYPIIGYAGADIRPDGSPVFAFQYLNGINQLDNPIELIQGAQWKKIPLANNNMNGNYFDKIANRQQATMSALGTLGSMAIGAASMGLGLAGIGAKQAESNMVREVITRDQFGDITKSVQTFEHVLGGRSPLIGAGINAFKGGAANYALSSLKQIQQQEVLSAQGLCAATPKFTAKSSFYQDLNQNNFYYVISQYAPEDIQEFDRFLTMYGYNVGSYSFEDSHFRSRTEFIYIRINDISIQSRKAGAELIDKVTNQLKAGVRIWRKKPNRAATMPGGNREIPDDLPVIEAV